MFYLGCYLANNSDAHFHSSIFVALTFQTFPPLKAAPGAEGFRKERVSPIELPPEVAKRMIFFPVKFELSRKEWMIFGAWYHQMGKPM